MQMFDDVAAFLVVAPLAIVFMTGLGIAIWAVRQDRDNRLSD